MVNHPPSSMYGIPRVMQVPPMMMPPSLQYPLVNNKKINISVCTITPIKHMHHLQEINDMLLLIKIIEIIYLTQHSTCPLGHGNHM